MPSFLPNPVKLAAKGAGTAFQIGSFVAGQAAQRMQSLLGRDDHGSASGSREPDYAPGKSSPAPSLQPVPEARPTTAKTTATGPGGRGRTAPPAPKKAPAARKAAASAPVEKEIVAKPSSSGTKGETTTTVKASSRTGARSAGGRISDPKAAKKARARSAGAAPKKGAGAGTGASVGAPTAAARTGDLSAAKGKGGRPATVKAENSPAEVAKSRSGKQAAPLGSDEK